ncbi:MAG TPA: GNAT family N-acetyltransferase [Anaerolineales bacterium]|nr:GNAT family N-acetyltransferase [Anaerolineales bacterium]
MMTTKTILTRVATSDDVQDLARLNAKFNGSSDPPEYLAMRLADRFCVEQPLLAEVDGHVVGFAALRIVPCVFYADPHGELTELFVEEPYRRQGVGRELLRLAEKIAKEKGVKELLILTDASNQAAQTFYNSMDYEDGELAFKKELAKS